MITKQKFVILAAGKGTELNKSMIHQYTRGDGTVVRAHSDRRSQGIMGKIKSKLSGRSSAGMKTLTEEKYLEFVEAAARKILSNPTLMKEAESRAQAHGVEVKKIIALTAKLSAEDVMQHNGYDVAGYLSGSTRGDA